MCHNSLGITTKTTEMNEELRAVFGFLHFILMKCLRVNTMIAPLSDEETEV